jgi:hypothetical protein
MSGSALAAGICFFRVFRQLPVASAIPLTRQCIQGCVTRPKSVDTATARHQR